VILPRSWRFIALGFFPLINPSNASLSAAAQLEQRPVQRRVTNIPIDDFVLFDQRGGRFQFAKLSGKVVVVSFAYTTCPDVCPLLTALMRNVQTGLTADERRNVQLLTITTDPEIDSPQVLAAYAKRFNVETDSWSFLTGDDAALKKVWKNFGVGVKRKGRGLVDHTPLIGIVDQKRILHFAYIGPSPAGKPMLKDIRSLLANR